MESTQALEGVIIDVAAERVLCTVEITIVLLQSVVLPEECVLNISLLL